MSKFQQPRNARTTQSLVNAFAFGKHNRLRVKRPVRGIELVVDGKIADLNQIRLPAVAQIIDKRFPER